MLALTLGAAAGLIGWSSLAAAVSQERNVRLRLAALPAASRSVQVVYFTLPGEEDVRAAPVAAAVASFRPSLARPYRVRIWHSIERHDPTGTRLVVAREPEADVALRSGRLPRGCRGRVCEALALRGRARVGDRLRLGRNATAVVVGLGALRPELLPDPSQLATSALLVRSLAPPLAPLVRETGSTVVVDAPLVPAEVHAAALPDLRERLRETVIRLARDDPLVRPKAPLALLAALDERGRVARERLRLVAGEGAALALAFAAYLARARKRDARLVTDQLATLGASRAQIAALRVVEAATPAALAAAAALVGLWLAARLSATPGAVSVVFSAATVAAVVGVCVAGAALLVGVSPRRRGRVGVLEVAAAAALAIVAWQTAATGALDPERIAAGGGGPVLLLVPALAFFACGVLLLRLAPAALRLGEHAARGRGPIALRLAFLGAARAPAHAAAATTFLAVALGGALFSLDYRATLDRQAADQARFAAGASWRVAERPDVTPLTRLRRLSAERPTPVLRLHGTVELASSQLDVQVLALPAGRVRDVLGWRNGFSPQTRTEIARRLRPVPVRLVGPRIAAEASALRVWARAQADYPRLVVLHFLLRGQGFAHLRLGLATARWHLLRAALPPPLRGAQLVGVEFAPTRVPVSFKYDPQGYVELGPFEQRRGGGWSQLRSLGRWKEATTPDGRAGILTAQRFTAGPVASGIRFDLNGTYQPLIHPKLGLPQPPQGFAVGTLPALAGAPVAAQAVGGLVTVDVAGARLPVRVVARASLFPSVVERPGNFLVLDYDTLFAALNAPQPGVAPPTEAWFFTPPPMRIARLPSGARVTAAAPLASALRADPLARGARDVLLVAAIVAAVLAVAGMLLAARSTVAGERPLLAEYEALGLSPRTLRRATQLRLVVLAAFGTAAGLAGAFVGVRLVGAFVAVTGAARRPLPPIAPVVSWSLAAALVVAVAVGGIAGAALLAARTLREPAARRLRA